MFSKEESKRIRQEFWISFGKSFPRKWVLYNTKIKDVYFKFYFDTATARVSIDFEAIDPAKRRLYYEKFIALKEPFKGRVPNLQYSESVILDTGKQISSIYVELKEVSIHTKETWRATMYFLKEHMETFEDLWFEYEDYIKS